MKAVSTNNFEVTIRDQLPADLAHRKHRMGARGTMVDQTNCKRNALILHIIFRPVSERVHQGGLVVQIDGAQVHVQQIPRRALLGQQ